MASTKKKRSLIDKLLIIGAAATFILLTVSFSPMIWMLALFAVLPIAVMVILITPTVHLNIVERQTEDNRL